jgi:hypothetical protein
MFITPTPRKNFSRDRLLLTPPGYEKKSTKNAKCFVRDAPDTPSYDGGVRVMDGGVLISRSRMLLRSGFNFRSPGVRTQTQSFFSSADGAAEKRRNYRPDLEGRGATLQTG